MWVGRFFGVRSCLLIILIKSLKGHKSLGSLCSVVKTLIVSGNGPTNGRTMSPIELFWTAKNQAFVIKHTMGNKYNLLTSLYLHCT